MLDETPLQLDWERIKQGLSAGTGKLCIFGHLGLVFIWSCFVSCLLLLLYYVICAPVLTEGTIKQSYYVERGEIGRLFEGGHLIEGRLLFEEIRYLGHTTDTIRDLKMPRRRRKRERQSLEYGKTTTLHVQHAFLYFSLPSLHVYDGKMPNFTFYIKDDVNK